MSMDDDDDEDDQDGENDSIISSENFAAGDADSADSYQNRKQFVDGMSDEEEQDDDGEHDEDDDDDDGLETQDSV